MTTHYIAAFTETNGKLQRTACGKWTREEYHANEPTCERCKAFVESQPGDDVTAEDMFGEAPESYPPTKPQFDPCKDYSERRR